MITTGDIMIKNPLTVSPDLSVGKATGLMERFKIGGLPVTDGDRVVGIITSRDIRKSHPNRLVADVMTREVLTVSPEFSLWEAKEFIEKHGVERLVVTKEEKILGVVTKSLLYIEFGKQIDTLTGLYRSEFLYHMAFKLLKEEREIAVIFIDINNFGIIDKEMGHVFGDFILKQVADIFKSIIEEKTDYLCRYAGDEFAIVTIRPLEETKKLVSSLLASLTNQPWPNGVKLSASAGIAGGRRSCPRPGNECCTISELINLASLGSTRAKKENIRAVVVGQVKVVRID